MEQVGFICFQQKFSETARLLGSLRACFIVHPQLELKKTLLDRMVHLLSRGYVLPVVSYIRKCLEKLNTDISLIRYFVTEVKATYHLEDKKNTMTRLNVRPQQTSFLLDVLISSLLSNNSDRGELC